MALCHQSRTCRVFKRPISRKIPKIFEASTIQAEEETRFYYHEEVVTFLLNFGTTIALSSHKV